MAKFKNKYRIESNRKPNWDYSSNGLYFLTFVTQNRKCNLGKIIDKKMILSDFGKIVDDQWLKSFEIRNELFLDEYQIMPNHIHAIVEIRKSPSFHLETHGRASHLNIDETSQDVSKVETSQDVSKVETSQDVSKVETSQDVSMIKRNPAVRLPKSISSFMGGFKSAVNTEIDNYIDENGMFMIKFNKHNHFFQPNYHDHIIRNHDEYIKIKKYIQHNPMNWTNDSLNKKDKQPL
jgi:REP element-mobilizing transposase RayT